MLGMIKYALMFTLAMILLLFAIGMIFTAFHTEPADRIEEALEEVTRKRGSKRK